MVNPNPFPTTHEKAMSAPTPETITEVLAIDLENPQMEILEKASQLLHRGAVVAFPTETVYGLGANALNSLAVAEIFRVKDRPATNPLIVHIADRAQLCRSSRTGRIGHKGWQTASGRGR